MNMYHGENNIDAPAKDFEVAIPDTPLTKGPCRALYVGTGGDLSVEMGGRTVVFPNTQDGQIYEIRVTQVNSASVASGIVALY